MDVEIGRTGAVAGSPQKAARHFSEITSRGRVAIPRWVRRGAGGRCVAGRCSEAGPFRSGSRRRRRRRPRTRRSDSTGRAATMPMRPCAAAIRPSARRRSRARYPLPRLELFLSRHGGDPRRTPAQVTGASRGPRTLLRLRRARRRRHRTAQRCDRVRDRSGRRRSRASICRPIRPARAALTPATGSRKCRAWTYPRPGYISTAAPCYLKDRMSRPGTIPAASRAWSGSGRPFACRTRRGTSASSARKAREPGIHIPGANCCGDTGLCNFPGSRFARPGQVAWRSRPTLYQVVLYSAPMVLTLPGRARVRHGALEAERAEQLLLGCQAVDRRRATRSG